MPRQFVICSDGTGQEYGTHKSNVARLFKLLDLDEKKEEQTGCYCPGVGTVADEATQKEIEAAQPYRIQIPPTKSNALRSRMGMLFGNGLQDNIHYMYDALVDNYAEGDQIFMFGFSRGAFAVRALAGLLCRCGLLLPDKKHMFDKAYKLYEPHQEDKGAVNRFRDEHCRPNTIYVEFLGLWDTVKSYGYVTPISLPHTRYNTIVKNVRHALALGETRSFYIPTTWGGLDDPPDKVKKPQYPGQTLSEIWFAGDHSDVGGGHKDAEGYSPSRYTLEWMINEATASPFQLRIKQPTNEYDLLLPPGNEPKTHNLLESNNYTWRGLEYFPRFELDNSGEKTKRHFRFYGFDGARDPKAFPRQGEVHIHRSAEAVLGSDKFNEVVRNCESERTTVKFEPPKQ